MIIEQISANKDSLDLDITQLSDGLEYEKVCYLLDYKTGITKQEKGFYTFYVKDVNANVIAARLFNLAEYIDSGFTAMMLKSKPVKIKFMAQLWDGTWSLIVKEISNWDGDFNYENYIGKAEYNAEPLEAVYNSIFGERLNPEYYSEFFPELCDGRIGGFISVLEKSFTQLYSYKIESLNPKELHKCFFICMNAYFNYLKLKKQYSIVPSQNVFDLLNAVRYQYDGYEFLKETVDTILSLTGLAQPQHIYSHLICGVVNQTQNLLTLVYKNQSMPLGSSTTIGNKTLIRF